MGQNRIGLLAHAIRTLLLVKPGTDTLVRDPKSSLDKRRKVNLVTAQMLARVVVLLVCLLVGVWVDDPWIDQLILML